LVGYALEDLYKVVKRPVNELVRYDRILARTSSKKY